MYCTEQGLRHGEDGRWLDVLGTGEVAERDDEGRPSATSMCWMTNYSYAVTRMRRWSAVNTVRRNADHLLTIINDTLDMSRIEVGKLSVERISTELAPLLTQILSLVQPRAEEKGIQLRAFLRTDIPPCVATDPTRLRQILLDLLAVLENAPRKVVPSARPVSVWEGHQTCGSMYSSCKRRRMADIGH